MGLRMLGPDGQAKEFPCDQSWLSSVLLPAQLMGLHRNWPVMLLAPHGPYLFENHTYNKKYCSRSFPIRACRACAETVICLHLAPKKVLITHRISQCLPQDCESPQSFLKNAQPAKLRAPTWRMLSESSTCTCAGSFCESAAGAFAAGLQKRRG